MLRLMSHSEKQICLFSDHFEKMGSDSRAMKGTYLSPWIPGDMANCIYLTRKSLCHDDWRRKVYNGRTIVQNITFGCTAAIIQFAPSGASCEGVQKNVQ